MFKLASEAKRLWIAERNVQEVVPGQPPYLWECFEGDLLCTIFFEFGSRSLEFLPLNVDGSG